MQSDHTPTCTSSTKTQVASLYVTMHIVPFKMVNDVTLDIYLNLSYLIYTMK